MFGDGPPGFWGQWESHYGPMTRRPVYRQHQAASMFAPTAGIRARGPSLLPRPMGNLPILNQSAERERPVAASGQSSASLYYDFNAPTRPNILTIRCAVQSIRADFQWNAPKVNKNINYTYKIKISGGSKGEILMEYPYWKTSASHDLDPGNWYTVTIEATAGNRIIAAGEVKFKSILCAAEMATLQMKAISYLQTVHGPNQMQEIIIFYRNKPPEYWKKIESYDAIMRPYLKDQCGMPGSPINGEINGLFFSARLHGGLLPTSSPFGGQRLKLLCPKLFLPETHNMYFGDFYCNTYVHYVTVVICYKNSPVDYFCRDKLDLLDPFNNLFLQLTVDDFGNYRYFINNNVWVEVYFTGDVPLWWGEFDYTISLGQSKPNGIPNNKYCKLCNLYPLEGPLTQEEAAWDSKEGGAKAVKRKGLDDTSTNQMAKKSRLDWIQVEIPESLTRSRDHQDENSTFHLLMEMARANSDPDFEESAPDIIDLLVELIGHVTKTVDQQDRPIGERPRSVTPPPRVKISYNPNATLANEKSIIEKLFTPKNENIERKPEELNENEQNLERKPDENDEKSIKTDDQSGLNTVKNEENTQNVERKPEKLNEIKENLILQNAERKPDVLNFTNVQIKQEKIDNIDQKLDDLQKVIDDIQSPLVKLETDQWAKEGAELSEKSSVLIGQDEKSSTLIGQNEKSNVLIGHQEKSNVLIGHQEKSNVLIGQNEKSSVLIGGNDENRRPLTPPPLPAPPTLEELANQATQSEYQLKKMNEDLNVLKNFLKSLEKKLFSLV